MIKEADRAATTDPKRPSAAGLPAKSDAPRMFDRIAPRYDLLNRLLSGRRDVAWRRQVAALLPDRDRLEVLDIATGTADILLTLFERRHNIASGVGADMAGKMLAIGQDKIRAAGLNERIELVQADALALPFADSSFDAVTIAFGIRNVTDVVRGLTEMNRVLRPGGRALILEFSLPANALIRWGYLLYFRHILPRLGALISGDRGAYRYLNQTVEDFPYGTAFCDLMLTAGFADVTALPLTFGIASIYSGYRK